MACDNFLWFPAAATGGNLQGQATQPAGESSDNWMGMNTTYKAMEVLSFSFDVSQADTGGSATGGASAGKAKFGEFTVEKFVDKASIPLFNACTAGAHYPTVMLAIRKQGGSSLLYLQYVFRQVFVTSIAWGGGGGEENPKETIKFKFGAMGIQYVRQKPDGTGDSPAVGMWNQIANNPSLTITGLPAPPGFLNASQS